MTTKCACGAPATHVTSDECARLSAPRDPHTGRFKKDPRKGKPRPLFHTHSCAAHACSKCVALAT